MESFNGKLRDELLDREIFYTLTEAQILIERWRREYNTVRTQERPRQRHPEDDRKKEDRSQEAVTAGQSRRSAK